MAFVPIHKDVLRIGPTLKSKARGLAIPSRQIRLKLKLPKKLDTLRGLTKVKLFLILTVPIQKAWKGSEEEKGSPELAAPSAQASGSKSRPPPEDEYSQIPEYPKTPP
ncbi:MAG: hypothetical protein R3B83_03785 [Nitrospirales bacterium]|nr:hypothetical protein [Nitrospirales bacterium]